MGDEPKGIEADEPHDGLVAIYRREIPKLIVLLSSTTRGTGLTAADIEDILQETILRVLDSLARTGVRPDNPRAYLYRAMTNSLVERIRQWKRQPGLLSDDDRRIVDPKTQNAEEFLEEPEARDRSERRMQQMREWASRFLATLGELGNILDELGGLEGNWPFETSNGRSENKRKRGRPTKARQIQRIIKEMPGQIALITKYILER